MIVAGSSVAVADLGRDAAHGVDDLGPAAVVDRQAHAEARIARTQANGLVEFPHRAFGQPFAAADPGHPGIAGHDLRPLFHEVPLEQLQEKIEFLGRAFPVFAGKAIKRDLLDAQPVALFRHPADAGGALAMSFDARQAPLPGPAPVAIHDDGDVPRQTIGRNVRKFGRCCGQAWHGSGERRGERGPGGAAALRLPPSAFRPPFSSSPQSLIPDPFRKYRLLAVRTDRNHFHRPAQQLAEAIEILPARCRANRPGDARRGFPSASRAASHTPAPRAADRRRGWESR